MRRRLEPDHVFLPSMRLENQGHVSEVFTLGIKGKIKLMDALRRHWPSHRHLALVSVMLHARCAEGPVLEERSVAVPRKGPTLPVKTTTATHTKPACSGFLLLRCFFGRIPRSLIPQFRGSSGPATIPSHAKLWEPPLGDTN